MSEIQFPEMAQGRSTVSQERIPDSGRDAILSWDLSPRQLCDLELLLNGGFAPLDRFMGQEDYESVLERCRLADGAVFPVPVMLDLPEVFAGSLAMGSRIALRDPEGTVIAVMILRERWKAPLFREAHQVCGSISPAHPGVADLFRNRHPVYVSGPLQGVHAPIHYDFLHLRQSPAELRHKFSEWGWTKVVGFQTGTPMHRAHLEVTFRAAKSVGANLLIHPVPGIGAPGDAERFARVRCYEHLIRHYPEHMATLSLLPLADRFAGSRTALWHALIRKNYGCTHVLLGRDDAGAGGDPRDAHAFVLAYAEEIGIVPLPYREMVYVPSRDCFMEQEEVPPEETVPSMSPAEIKRRLEEGVDLPSWFTTPEIVRELRRACPPRERRGFAVFFSGLSGAGKSTIANCLRTKLMEIGGRPITLLDGDVVRKNLSSELGYSREDRDRNILRMAFVAGEIAKNGGIVLCAPIAPFEGARNRAAEMIREHGGFVLVFVKTPLDICESRDRKALYARARSGQIPDFTGISSPYEEPENPDVVIETTATTPAEAAQTIILKLEQMGYLR